MMRPCHRFWCPATEIQLKRLTTSKDMPFLKRDVLASISPQFRWLASMLLALVVSSSDATYLVVAITITQSAVYQ